MKLNSVVDQITNSSGTTYVFSDEECLENAKKVLKIIMEVLKIEGNVEDYFDISLYFDDGNYGFATKEDFEEEMGRKAGPPEFKIRITAKDNNLDIAPMMDGLFKGLNTYQEDMFFYGTAKSWYNDKKLQESLGDY